MLNKYDPNVVVSQVGDVLVRKPGVSDLLVRLELVRITMIEMTDQGTFVCIESCNGLDDIKIRMWYDAALAYYDFYRDANWKESERPTAKEDENPSPPSPEDDALSPPLSFIEWLYQDQLAAAQGRHPRTVVTPPKPDYHRIVNGRVELANQLDRAYAEVKDELQKQCAQTVELDKAQEKDFTAYHTIRADGTYVKRRWGKVEELAYKGAMIPNWRDVDWSRQCM